METTAVIEARKQLDKVSRSLLRLAESDTHKDNDVVVDALLDAVAAIDTAKSTLHRNSRNAATK